MLIKNLIMSLNSIILAEEMIEKYLIDFSALRSEDCCKYWIYPSALVCNDNSSKLFNDKNECKNYYTLLFLSLNTKNYKMTKIDSLKIQPINKKVVVANLNARRVDINNSLIQKLNCIYTLFINEEFKPKIKVATCF